MKKKRKTGATVTVRKVKGTIASKAKKLAAKYVRANTLTFKRIVVENAYVFSGRHEVPLDGVGLVKVTGENRDTKEVSSNGSGKSMLWKCMLRLFYGRKALCGEPVTAAYNPDTQNMLIECEFERGGKCYIVRETRKHKDFLDGLHVTCDGKPWGAKNDPELLRKEIQTVLNRTYEEFVGTIIWKQNVDHILISGTPSERSQWISNFFGLNVYDELFKKFSYKLDIVRAQIQDLAQVRGKITTLEQQLQEHDKKKTDALVAKYTDTAASIESEIKRIRLRERKARRYVDLQKTIDKLKSRIDQKYQSLSDVRKQQRKTEHRIETARKRIKENSKVQEAICDKKQRTKAIENNDKKALLLYQEVLGGGGKLPSRDQLMELLVQAKSKKVLLEQQLQQAKSSEKANADALAARKELDDINYLECTGKYLRKLRRNSLALITECDKIIAKTETVTEREQLLTQHLRTCPTCGSVVDTERLQTAVDSAHEELRAAKAERKKAASELKYIERALILRERLDKNVGVEVVDVETLNKRLLKISVKIEALSKMIEFAEDNAEHKQAIKALGDVGEIDESFDHEKEKRILTAAMDKMDVLHEQETLHRQLRDNIKELPEVGQRITNESVDKLSAAADALDAKQKETAQKLGRLLQQQTQARSLEKELSRLRPQMLMLAKQERRERIYKALKKAYDKNGLKTRRLRELLQAVQERLPVWTNILFTESNMKIATTGNEKKIGFEVTQTRKPESGKGKTVTKKFDVREASGSERTRISCALMLTMADVASSEKQCNLLVLDELERGLDRPSRRIMSEEIIPLLKHKKPSLFLITHSLDVDREHVNSYLTIVKKNQRSRIKFVRNK